MRFHNDLGFMEKIYCFDLDGTLTKNELLPIIAKDVGLQHELGILTQLTIDGLISFEDSFKLRFSILKSIPISRVQGIISQELLFGGVIKFIRENTKNSFIITGNLDCWVKPILDKINCGIYTSTARQSGDFVSDLLYIMHKSEAINNIKKKHPNSEIVCIGDGFNDCSMFEISDIGIAVGYVHPPNKMLIEVSDYVVYEEGTLCRLLNTL